MLRSIQKEKEKKENKCKFFSYPKKYCTICFFLFEFIHATLSFVILIKREIHPKNVRENIFNFCVIFVLKKQKKKHRERKRIEKKIVYCLYTRRGRFRRSPVTCHRL